jgi:hypothetical protein
MPVPADECISVGRLKRGVYTPVVGAPNVSEVLARRSERDGPRIDRWVSGLRDEPKMTRCNVPSMVCKYDRWTSKRERH